MVTHVNVLEKVSEYPPLCDRLIEKIEDRSAVIGIVGLGYVGVPLVLRFADAGFKVIGFDIDADKVAILNANKSFIQHISGDAIARARGAGFEATRKSVV